MTNVLWAVLMKRVDAPAPRERSVCLHALLRRMYMHICYVLDVFARHALGPGSVRPTSSGTVFRGAPPRLRPPRARAGGLRFSEASEMLLRYPLLYHLMAAHLGLLFWKGVA